MVAAVPVVHERDILRVLAAAREGGELAVVRFTELCCGPLVQYAESRGTPDPEGVAHLTIVDVLRRLDRLTFDSPSQAWAYLYTVARSNIAAERRAARRRPPEVDLAHAEPLAVDREEHTLNRLLVRDTLAALTPAQAEVLALRFLEDRSIAETAACTGRSEHSVKALQRRALRSAAAFLTAALAVVVWQLWSHLDNPVSVSTVTDGVPAVTATTGPIDGVVGAEQDPPSTTVPEERPVPESSVVPEASAVTESSLPGGPATTLANPAADLSIPSGREGSPGVTVPAGAGPGVGGPGSTSTPERVPLITRPAMPGPADTSTPAATSPSTTARPITLLRPTTTRRFTLTTPPSSTLPAPALPLVPLASRPTVASTPAEPVWTCGGVSGTVAELTARGYDVVIGTDGDDRLRVDDDKPGFVIGGDGDDRIYGGDRDDIICAGPGNDHVDGGDGNDTIYGGPGDDRIDGGDDDDWIDGGDGNDHIDGGSGDDTLYGGSGDDEIEGGRGNDYIDGGEGSDDIDGGSGDNILIGGPGIDRIDGRWE